MLLSMNLKKKIKWKKPHTTTLNREKSPTPNPPQHTHTHTKKEKKKRKQTKTKYNNYSVYSVYCRKHSKKIPTKMHLDNNAKLSKYQETSHIKSR